MELHVEAIPQPVWFSVGLLLYRKA